MVTLQSILQHLSFSEKTDACKLQSFSRTVSQHVTFFFQSFKTQSNWSTKLEIFSIFMSFSNIENDISLWCFLRYLKIELRKNGYMQIVEIFRSCFTDCNFFLQSVLTSTTKSQRAVLHISNFGQGVKFYRTDGHQTPNTEQSKS